MTDDDLLELLHLLPDPPDHLVVGARRWFRERLRLEAELADEMSRLDRRRARRSPRPAVVSDEVERRLAARAFSR